MVPQRLGYVLHDELEPVHSSQRSREMVPHVALHELHWDHCQLQVTGLVVVVVVVGLAVVVVGLAVVVVVGHWMYWVGC